MDTFQFKESFFPISATIRDLGVDTDLNIICENIVFRAHRAVFGGFSNYLLKLFLEEPTGNYNIITEDVQPKDVVQILNFVYNSRVKFSPIYSKGFISLVKQLKIDHFLKLNLSNTTKTISEGSSNSELQILDPKKGVPAIVDNVVSSPVIPDKPDNTESELYSNNSSRENGQSSSSGKVFVFKVPLPPKSTKSVISRNSQSVSPSNSNEAFGTSTIMKSCPERDQSLHITKIKPPNTPPPKIKPVHVSTPIPKMITESDVPDNRELVLVQHKHKPGFPLKDITNTTRTNCFGLPIFSSTLISNDQKIRHIPIAQKNEINCLLKQRKFLIETDVSNTFSVQNRNNSRVIKRMAPSTNTRHKLKQDTMTNCTKKKMVESIMSKRAKLDDYQPDLDTESDKEIISILTSSTLDDDGDRPEKIQDILKRRTSLPNDSYRPTKDSLQDTDSDDEDKTLKPRRKVPIERRRRIPASTRPILLDTTTYNTTENDSIEKPLFRRKFGKAYYNKNKIG